MFLEDKCLEGTQIVWVNDSWSGQGHLTRSSYVCVNNWTKRGAAVIVEKLHNLQRVNISSTLMLWVGNIGFKSLFRLSKLEKWKMFWNILCLAWYVYSVQCIKLYSFLLLNRTHAQIAPIRLTAKYVYLNSDMTECVVIYFWWKCRLLSSNFGLWKFKSIFVVIYDKSVFISKQFFKFLQDKFYFA